MSQIPNSLSNITCKAYNLVSCEKGFTLIEILVVLAIVIMIYGVFSPSFARLSTGASFKASAQLLHDDVKTLRAKAIATGKSTQLIVTDQGHGYSAGEQVRTLNRESRIALIGTHSDRITYYPDGKSEGYSITLSAGDSTVSLSSNWLTGHIERTPIQSKN